MTKKAIISWIVGVGLAVILVVFIMLYMFNKPSNSGVQTNTTEVGKEYPKSKFKIVAGQDYNYVVRKTAKRIYVHEDALFTMGQKPYNASEDLFGACGEQEWLGNQWCQKMYLASKWPDYKFTKVTDKNSKFWGYWYCENPGLLIHQFNLVQVYEEYEKEEDRYSWAYVDQFNIAKDKDLCKWYFVGPKERSCIDPTLIKEEAEG